MRIDKGGLINDFIGRSVSQYVIPVYQRNYGWSSDQCRKLFHDVIKASQKHWEHFCGSIVFAEQKIDNKINYYIIIDGQQRLTTIYLFLKALLDEAVDGSDKQVLKEVLFNKDDYKEYSISDSTKLKLKPIKSDNTQLLLLMDNKIDQMDKSSGIYRNYVLFRELIREQTDSPNNISIRNIYEGIKNLICATIRLEDRDDNAQEIFERINSTGMDLNLADKIRNFVLMTDVEQERLYEDYWLKIEKKLTSRQLPTFFLNYINMKLDGFAKEETAYDSFKYLYDKGGYDNESILKELSHYSDFYYTFLNHDDSYSEKVNELLDGLRKLSQSTVYLFLFHIFDDYHSNIIDNDELERILAFLLSYSLRRLMCEIPSNSLRGLYKTLYSRVFTNQDNKKHYYDSIVSFMKQLTTKDAIPDDEEFTTALINNNLYRKHALCKYLLSSIENQGKERIVTDTLTIEHILPQNKDLSTSWQQMLGDKWIIDRDKWLHTLGNLTLTGYNTELGDKPFSKKKELIAEKQTKVVILYKDIKDKDSWNSTNIKLRAENLAKNVIKLFPIEEPEQKMTFTDTRYQLYTAEETV